MKGTHEGGKGLEVDGGDKEAMDKNISVSSDWRCEVGVERSS